MVSGALSPRRGPYQELRKLTIESDDDETGHPDTPVRQNSMRSEYYTTSYRLLRLNAFALFYGIFRGGNMVLIPAEIDRMFGVDKDIALALTTGIAGLLTIVGPITGFYSDACTSRYGRRRPFLVGGSVICVLAMFLMHLSSSSFGGPRKPGETLDVSRTLSAAGFIFSFLVANTGLMMATTAYNCLLPDCVPKPYLGKASGYMALMTIAGTMLGFAFYFITGGGAEEFWQLYVLNTVVLFVTVSLTITFIDDPSSEPEERQSTLSVSSMLVSVISGLQKNRDFFFVWLSRVLYYMGLSALAYLQYFVKDVVESSNPVLDSAIIGCVALIGGLLSSVPMGRLSDRIGRKPLIFVATGLLMISYVVFPNTDNVDSAMFAGALFGIGQGIYLSVEWALGCLTLPDMENQAGRDLGVWAVAQTLGDVVGPFTMGPILYYFSRSPVPWTSGESLLDVPTTRRQGYFFINGVGCLYFTIAAYLVARVKSVT